MGDDLTTRLEKLALRSKDGIDDNSKALQREIDSAGFRIFECISDHGYYAWNPPHGLKTMNLSSITSKDQLTQYLDVNGKPGKMVDHRSLQLPRRILTLAPYENENRFPYGNHDIVGLHVASKYRNITLDDMDFCFGGSTLGMLASCDASDPYMVTKVPGAKNMLLVIKNKDYVADYGGFGFQFERLMTGIGMDCFDSADGNTEHLHVMNVDDHRVLFRADTDAMQDGSPVEIKASNPRYWGTKVMFQMISSGSTKLCHGKRGRGELISVSMQPLRDVARSSVMSSRQVQTLEQNILAGMKSIKDQMEDVAHGEVFKVSFDRHGSLKLLPARGRSADILPGAQIVREMIGNHS